MLQMRANTPTEVATIATHYKSNRWKKKKIPTHFSYVETGKRRRCGGRGQTKYNGAALFL